MPIMAKAMARGWVAGLDTPDGLDALRRLLLDRANLLAVAQRVVDRGSVTAATAEPALLPALRPLVNPSDTRERQEICRRQ